MTAIHQISGYETSRDYERLADEMQRRSVICVVDCYGDCRDIAKTGYSESNHGQTWKIGCRGIEYIWADDRGGFIRQCVRLNVDAIF